MMRRFLSLSAALLAALSPVVVSGQEITPDLCFGGFGALQFRFDAYDRYTEFFRNESEFINWQAGSYVGPEAIEEYTRFLSPTNKAVGLADGVHQPGFRGIVNGTCEILLFTNSWYEFLPETARAGKVNVTLMSLIQFDPIENYIKRFVLHLPPAWMPSLFGVTLGTDRTRDSICRVMRDNCTEIWEQNQEAFSQVPVAQGRSAGHGDDDDDLIPCKTLLRDMPAVTEEHYLDGNSQGCRSLHAHYASVNEFHCPHISFVPAEDKDGKIKCQESDMRLETQYFTEEDLKKYDEFMKENSDRVDYPAGFRVYDLEEMDESEIEGDYEHAEIDADLESDPEGTDGASAALGNLGMSSFCALALLVSALF